MKLSALRLVVREELSRLNEVSFAQAGADQPLTQFIKHLNMAKADLNELFQQTTDTKAGNTATKLLNQLNAIILSLDHAPELTKNPFADAGRKARR